MNTDGILIILESTQEHKVTIEEIARITARWLRIRSTRTRVYVRVRGQESEAVILSFDGTMTGSRGFSYVEGSEWLSNWGVYYERKA
jgi:hypothetical protein